MIPLIFVVAFLGLCIWAGIKASRDLDFCIRHTITNKAKKDFEFDEMKRQLEELRRNHEHS